MPLAKPVMVQLVVGTVIVHVLVASSTVVTRYLSAVPPGPVPAVRVMVVPSAYVPGTVMVGVASLVRLSVELVPRSDEAARSGADGVAGTTFNVPVPLTPLLLN